MKHLHFPISAEAVHLHGREFHDQDFFVPLTGSAGDEGGARACVSPPASALDAGNPLHPAYRSRADSGDSVWKLVRWTAACVALAVAAAFLLSGLVRSDLQHVQWVESTAIQGSSASR